MALGDDILNRLLVTEPTVTEEEEEKPKPEALSLGDQILSRSLAPTPTPAPVTPEPTPSPAVLETPAAAEPEKKPFLERAFPETFAKQRRVGPGTLGSTILEALNIPTRALAAITTEQKFEEPAAFLAKKPVEAVKEAVTDLENKAIERFGVETPSGKKALPPQARVGFEAIRQATDFTGRFISDPLVAAGGTVARVFRKGAKSVTRMAMLEDEIAIKAKNLTVAEKAQGELEKSILLRRGEPGLNEQELSFMRQNSDKLGKEVEQATQELNAAKARVTPTAPPTIEPGIPKVEKQIPLRVDLSKPDFKEASGLRKKIQEKSRPVTDLFNSVERGLETRGEPGRQFLQTIKNWENESRTFTGAHVSDYATIVKGLSKAEKVNVRKSLQGELPNAPDKIKKAAEDVRGLYNTLFRKAEAAGLKTGWIDKDGAYNAGEALAYRKDYFPVKLDINKIRKKQDEVKKFLLDSGQVKTEAKADALVQLIIEHDATLQTTGKFVDRSHIRELAKRAGNVEFARKMKAKLPEEFYINNLDDVTINYISRLGNRVSQLKNFGDKNQTINNLVNSGASIDDINYFSRVRDLALNVDQSEDIFRAFKRGDVVTGKLLSADLMMNFTGITSLQNLTQNIYPIAKAGYINSSKALARTILNPKVSVDEAKRAGAMLNETIKSLSEVMAGNQGGRLTNAYLKTIGFTYAERANRILTTQIGKELAKDVFPKMRTSQAVLRKWRPEFKKMGVPEIDEALKSGKLTEDQILTFGGGFSDRFHFSRSITELPLKIQEGVRSSNVLRLMFQYKSFAFKQANVIVQEFIKDPAAMARLFPLAVGGGELIRGVRGREAPENPALRILQDFAYVGSLGFYSDAIADAVITKRTIGGNITQQFIPAAADNIGKILTGRWDRLAPAKIVKKLTQPLAGE